MVRVDYSGRILADGSFVNWLLSDSSIPVKDRAQHLLHLMFIKSSSLCYNGENNVIMDFDMEEVKSTHPEKENTVRSAFREISVPELNSIVGNPILKRISCASLLASQNPRKTIYIFTDGGSTPQTYLQSPHLIPMKSVQVKGGWDALAIIDSFWRQFMDKRQEEHSNQI